MLPQLGVGGWTPIPRKLRAAIARSATAATMVVWNRITSRDIRQKVFSHDSKIAGSARDSRFDEPRLTQNEDLTSDESDVGRCTVDCYRYHDLVQRVVAQCDKSEDED